MSEESRSPVHAAVQQSINAERSEGHVVTGWVCVVESMAPDGERWLSRLSSDASGERRLPRWTEQGLLHNGLHGNGEEGWNEPADGADGGDGG